MMSKTFRKPNLSARQGGRREPCLSVRSDRSTIGINQRARDRLGAEPGQYLHFAFDRTRTPWVGVVDEPSTQGEPELLYDTGCMVNSRLLARHLIELLDEEPEGVVRFHFDGETADDPDTGATLHKLTVPQ